MKKPSAVVILSGGQDSATCLYWALERFDRVEALSFDYGQRHRIELECATELARAAGVKHTVAPLDVFKGLAPSALTDKSIDVSATGGLHNLPSTFVPGRNAFFLTASASFAAVRGIHDLVIGACEADFSGYPDCRDTFIAAMETALGLALDVKLAIHRPLMRLDKAQIFALANDLGHLEDVLERTHTCYEGVRGTLHAWGYGCGRCPACELRARGFENFLKGTHGRS